MSKRLAKGSYHNRSRRLIAELLEDRRCLATITGVVFEDTNLNGVRDPGEIGVASRIVNLDSNGDGAPDQTATTTDGVFLLENVANGTVELSLASTNSNEAVNLTHQGIISIEIADNDATADFPLVARDALFTDVASKGLEFLRASIQRNNDSITNGLPRNEATLEDLNASLFDDDDFFVPAQLGHIYSSFAAAHALTASNPSLTDSSSFGAFDDDALHAFASTSLNTLEGILQSESYQLRSGKAALYQVHSTSDGTTPRRTDFDRTVSLLDNVQLLVGLQELTNYLSRLPANAGPGGNGFADVIETGNRVINLIDLAPFFSDETQTLKIGGDDCLACGSDFDRITSETRQAALTLFAYGFISENQFDTILGSALRESQADPSGPLHKPFKGGALEIWVPTPHADGELDTAYGRDTLIALGNAWQSTLEQELAGSPAIGSMPIATEVGRFSELVNTPSERGDFLVDNPTEASEDELIVNKQLLVGPAAGILGAVLSDASVADESTRQFAVQNLASTVAAYREAGAYHQDYGLSNCLESPATICSATEQLRGTNEIGMMTEAILNQLLGGQFYTSLLEETPLETADWAGAFNKYYSELDVRIARDAAIEVAVEVETAENESSRSNASEGKTFKWNNDDPIIRALTVPSDGAFGLRIAYSHDNLPSDNAVTVRINSVQQGDPLSARNTEDWNHIVYSPVIPIGDRIQGELLNIQLDKVPSVSLIEIDRIELVEIPTVANETIVSISAERTEIRELRDETAITVSRSGDISEALSVQFTIGGTATGGDDFFTTLTAQNDIVIPAGEREITFVLGTTTPPDSDEAGVETVDLSIANSPDYLISVDPRSASITFDLYQPMIFDVLNTNDSGDGSLRSAIESANAAATASHPHLIRFDGLVGAGPHIIEVATPLPAITSSTQIDATLHANFTGTPVVQLDGNGAVDGLVLMSDSNTVSGLSITGFAGDGIEVRSSSNLITQNHLGVTPDSTADGNSFGLRIANGADNVIDDNVISGNQRAGSILIGAAATNNLFVNNRIGTNADGTQARANETDGIINFAPRTQIGLENQPNVISGNQRWGVFTKHTNQEPTFVQHNLIGTDITGQTTIGNAIGIYMQSGANVIDNNTVGGNSVVGVAIRSAVGSRIQGNRIGTNTNGTSALQNGVGVQIAPGNDNLVGGLGTDQENIISGNSDYGVSILGNPSSGNRIVGNKIGTDESGELAIGNQLEGIQVSRRSSDTTIFQNLISGNIGRAIGVYQSTSQVTIQSNKIGVNQDASKLLHNGTGSTVRVQAEDVQITDNTISGPGIGVMAIRHGDRLNISSNTFRNNYRGVSILSGSQHRISQNVFVDNTIAIDLGNDGITPNDPGDADNGFNNLQNSPVINTAQLSGDSLVINYSVDSENSSFPLTLEFFVISSGAFLGDDTLSAGNSIGEVTLDVSQLAEEHRNSAIRATTTTTNNNTSEFGEGTAISS